MTSRKRRRPASSRPRKCAICGTVLAEPFPSGMVGAMPAADLSPAERIRRRLGAAQ